MTGLLVSTFIFGGIHTLLWLPRAFQMRREIRAAENAVKESGSGPEALSETGGADD
jgi:hypothetical protein